MSDTVYTAFISPPPTCSTAHSDPAPCRVTDSSQFPPEFQSCVQPPTFSQCLPLKYLKVNMPKAKCTTVFPEAVLVLSQCHGHLSRWARKAQGLCLLSSALPQEGAERSACTQITVLLSGGPHKVSFLWTTSVLVSLQPPSLFSTPKLISQPSKETL